MKNQDTHSFRVSGRFVQILLPNTMGVLVCSRLLFSLTRFALVSHAVAMPEWRFGSGMSGVAPVLHTAGSD